jgi:transcriptional regulator with XRE-family HTH domain
MTTQRVERGWVPAETFGGRLALVRQHFGWNVKEAAIICRVPVETWRGWERDHTQPRRYLEVCRVIAEATGADYDWVLDGRRGTHESPGQEDANSTDDPNVVRLPRLDSNQQPFDDGATSPRNPARPIIVALPLAA